MTTAQPTFGMLGGAPVFAAPSGAREHATAHSPVFVDSSGRRRRTFTALGYLGAAACVTYVAAFGVTMTSNVGALDAVGTALAPTPPSSDDDGADVVGGADGPTVVSAVGQPASRAVRPVAATPASARPVAPRPAVGPAHAAPAPRPRVAPAVRPAVAPRAAAPRPAPVATAPAPTTPGATTPASGTTTGTPKTGGTTTTPTTGQGTTKPTTTDPAKADILT